MATINLTEEIERLIVWMQGHEIVGYDANIWRRDDFGSAMKYSDYGDRASKYGWEIDHITPNALGGSSALANKRPLNWRNNATAGGILSGLMR